MRRCYKYATTRDGAPLEEQGHVPRKIFLQYKSGLKWSTKTSIHDSFGSTFVGVVNCVAVSFLLLMTRILGRIARITLQQLTES